MNRLTHRAALTALIVLILSACPSTRIPPPAVTPDQIAQLPQPQPSEPEVVIEPALGGGASKGFAHISIIEILKESSTPAKIITGTSTGSIVGNLYILGMSPGRLELEAEILGKADLVDLTLSTSSFIRGEKLQSYINYKVGNRSIQQFPLKFVVVTTDFETGKAIAFNCGNAGQVVRISASTPSVLQPVVIDSRKYVDNGLSQPMPVSTIKVQGASFVITVDISARPTKNVNQSFFSYLDQTLDIMSAFALHNELGKADVVIKPKVLELGSVGGFSQKNHVIQLGEQTACAALPEIRRRLTAYRY